MINRKSKGTRNEHRSMDIFESAGYRTMRAGASLGVFDLIGIGSVDIVLCQVKTRDWPGSVEMEEIRNFNCPRNCRKIIHRWRDYQKKPDIKEVDPR